jgi:hypothetical protein
MRKPELQAFFLPQRGACRAVVRVSEAEDSFLGVGATISRSVFQDYFIQENEKGSEMWQSFGWNLSAADAYGPW